MSLWFFDDSFRIERHRACHKTLIGSRLASALRVGRIAREREARLAIFVEEAVRRGDSQKHERTLLKTVPDAPTSEMPEAA
jgi:hypothetical protein